MNAYIYMLKKLFTYKKPKDNEKFELLENSYEGNRVQNVTVADLDDNKQPGERTKKQPKENPKGNKKASPLEKWNEGKNKEKEIGKTSGNLVDYSLQTNIQRIKKEFKVPKNMDIIIREFKLANNIDAFIVYIEGMADKNTINDFVLRQIMSYENFNSFKGDCPLDYILNKILSINDVLKTADFEYEIIPKILSGLTALFIEGCPECLLIESRGFEKRKLDRPQTENVVHGPQEGFTEDMRTNITLIRRIIKNKNLITEIIPVGKTNNSNCAVMYIDGITSPALIKEVMRRVKSINADFVMGNGMLAQFIEDEPFMIFPQVLSTERPDRTASFLMEGQVILISEGTPFADAVPVTFFRMFHTSEDSFLRWQFGTLTRFIRLLGLLFGTFLPGIYIALTLYHREMIPTDLLVSIAKARENVPFPTIVEVLMMEISFELIREAGIRVPGVIGTTLGIIGALILGQAAVAANIVSPVLIIIVAVTGLGNFAIPTYELATGIRIIRFIFIFAGAVAGFYGLSAAIFMIGGLACSMKSFGVPFFSPIAPKTRKNPDVLVRQPIWKQEMRTDDLNAVDSKRQPKISRGWVKKKGGGKG